MMDDDFAVLEQRLVKGVVVSIGVDIAFLDYARMIPTQGVVQCRMRAATEREKQDHADGDELPKGTPV